MKKLTREELVATPVATTRITSGTELYAQLYQLEIGEGLLVGVKEANLVRPSTAISQYFRRRRLPHRFSIRLTMDKASYIIERKF